MEKKSLFEMGAKLDGDASSFSEPSSYKLPQKHELVFLYEKRNGKPVTIVKPFYLPKEELAQTLTSVKKKLGRGGTIDGQMLEFQGDVKAKVQTELEKLGFRFRKR